MSFTRVIGTQPPTDREIVVGCPHLEQPATGWDVLRETLWLPHPYFIPRGSFRDPPGPEGGTFITQDQRILEWKAGRPMVELISLGIANQDGKDYKIDGSASISEDFSLADWSYTIWRLAYPRVTKLWVSLVTPSLGAVNLPTVPPETFGLPVTPWGMTYVEPGNWSAGGWIAESRTPQQLPGSKACLVTDTWLYDPGYSDRDGAPRSVIYL
jgi:hypothetical protein